MQATVPTPPNRQSNRFSQVNHYFTVGILHDPLFSFYSWKNLFFPVAAKFQTSNITVPGRLYSLYTNLRKDGVAPTKKCKSKRASQEQNEEESYSPTNSILIYANHLWPFSSP